MKQYKSKERLAKFQLRSLKLDLLNVIFFKRKRSISPFFEEFDSGIVKGLIELKWFFNNGMTADACVDFSIEREKRFLDRSEI